jgi:hypothetical protein
MDCFVGFAEGETRWGDDSCGYGRRCASAFSRRRYGPKFALRMSLEKRGSRESRVPGAPAAVVGMTSLSQGLA